MYILQYRYILKNENIVHSDIIFFFKCLPFSPILGAVFYFGSNRDGWFAQSFLKDTLGLDVYNRFVNKRESEIEKWFREKLQKHIVFILESILEAFPNAILQMIAIVLYGKANIIAIISILLSMTSVSTKAFIFSQSIDNSIFLFNWLSAVADFFGVFFVISWVFYDSKIHINSGESFFDSFTFIGQLWVYAVKLIYINVHVLFID